MVSMVILISWNYRHKLENKMKNKSYFMTFMLFIQIGVEIQIGFAYINFLYAKCTILINLFLNYQLKRCVI